MTKKLIFWVTMASIITLLSGLVYASVQQDFRQSANDPQVQLSEDIAAKLKDGLDPTSVVPVEKVDLEKSLAPFVIVYNKNGGVADTNAFLNGKTPKIPDGVLTASKNSQNRLTWQPSVTSRNAAVITYYNGKSEGFVLVGRSLREVEIREERLMLMTFGIWALALIISFVGFVLLPLKLKK